MTMPSTDIQHRFQAGDRVSFPFRGRELQGRIARLNPKRALVVCDNDEEFRVPYALLTRLSPGSSPTPAQPDRTARELDDIARTAEELLTEHGLSGWTFAFDQGTRRAGSCQFDRRRITLSRHFARRAPEAEIRDTLLHEIAHALVGRQHHHDAVWQAAARRIGGSGRRCHDVRFTPPRYIVRCRNGCWVATAERRRRNVVCRTCHGEILYQTFTEQRWQALQQPPELIPDAP
jgi:predicted SprT family Zn-dependent metalloprotease